MFCPYPPPPAVLFCISIILCYTREENLQVMGKCGATTLLSGVVSKSLIPGHGASLMTSTSIVVCSDTSWAESIGGRGNGSSSSFNGGGGTCSDSNNLSGSSFSGSNRGGGSFSGGWSGSIGSWSLGFSNDNDGDRLGSCGWCRGRGGLRVRVSVRSRLSWGRDSHDNGSGGRFGSSGNGDGLSSNGDHDHVCNDINLCLDDLNGSADLKTLLDEWGSSCKGSADGSESD